MFGGGASSECGCGVGVRSVCSGIPSAKSTLRLSLRTLLFIRSKPALGPAGDVAFLSSGGDDRPVDADGEAPMVLAPPCCGVLSL